MAQEYIKMKNIKSVIKGLFNFIRHPVTARGPPVSLYLALRMPSGHIMIHVPYVNYHAFEMIIE